MEGHPFSPVEREAGTRQSPRDSFAIGMIGSLFLAGIVFYVLLQLVFALQHSLPGFGALWIGALQLAWVLPLAWWASRAGMRRLAAGLLAGGAVVGLLNLGAWFAFRMLWQAYWSRF